MAPGAGLDLEVVDLAVVRAEDLGEAEEDSEAAEVEAVGVAAANRVTTPIAVGRITAGTPASATGAGHSRPIPVQSL
jgi:hypothetical protein